MDDHLGYEKHEVKNKKILNSRNRHSRNIVASEYGDVQLEIPRDRQGEFEPAMQQMGMRLLNVPIISSDSYVVMTGCRCILNELLFSDSVLLVRRLISSY